MYIELLNYYFYFFFSWEYVLKTKTLAFLNPNKADTTAVCTVLVQAVIRFFLRKDIIFFI